MKGYHVAVEKKKLYDNTVSQYMHAQCFVILTHNRMDVKNIFLLI